MIIDGDPTFAENAQEALEAAGLTVHVRFDASLEEVRNLRPRVLMLCAELPRGSGFSICSRIRRDRSLRNLPIFMTTAEATEQALETHARSTEPADDYARKDISMTELVDRVGRLLTQGPASSDADANAEPGPETDRMVVLPPPLPARSESPGEASKPATGPVTGTAQMLELWPKETLDAEFRQALAANDVDPLPKGRATPEERLAHLRQLVKQHEAREKAVRQLWQQLLDRGQDLARRLVTVSADLVDHRDAVEQLRAARTEAVQQRQSVQTEFKRFEEEIRRIFKEKDQEEQALQSELAALKAEHAPAAEALAAAKEQKRDDERRLKILREELDASITDKERATREVEALAARAEEAESQVRDLSARLETAEHVAKARAEELQALRDRHDQLTYDNQQQHDALERRHAESLRELRAQHKAELSAELTATRSAHRSAVEALVERHERRVAELEAARSAAERQMEDRLGSLVEEHERNTRSLLASHETELERVGAERDDARTEAEHVRSMLDRAAAAVTKLRQEAVDERASFDTRLASARADLERQLELATAAAQEARADLDAYRTETAQHTNELERTLSAAQGQLLDTRAELDQERTAREALETTFAGHREEAGRAQQERARLRAERDDAVQRAVQAEAAKGKLETKLADAEGLLQTARRHMVEREETMRRRESEFVALRAELQAQRAEREARQAELAEAHEVQHDLEEQVDKLARARSGLEQALAEHRSKHGAALSEIQTLRGRVSALESAYTAVSRQRGDDRVAALQAAVDAQRETLDEAKFAAESIRNALDALSRDLAEERRHANSPRVSALLDRIERVVDMSREALDSNDLERAAESLGEHRDRIDNGAADIDPITSPFGDPDQLRLVGEDAVTQLRAGGSALSFDETQPTQTGGALPGLVAPAGLRRDDADEDANVTEIIDITKVD